jgi:hypothetical protein
MIATAAMAGAMVMAAELAGDMKGTHIYCKDSSLSF